MQTTIVYKKIQMDVYYSKQEEEKQTLEYPGCEEEIEIEEIWFGGYNVFNLLYPQLSEIENELLKTLSENK